MNSISANLNIMIKASEKASKILIRDFGEIEKLQVSKNCIVDTTDSTITFDDKGWCDYCINYHNHIVSNWDTGEQGECELLII